MRIAPARLAKIAAAADAGDAVRLPSAEVAELVRGYRKSLAPAKARREQVVHGDLAQLEVVVTVPTSLVSRYTHKGQGQTWVYDLAAVAEAVGVSEAKARRIAKGEVEGLHLRPSNLADVVALYAAIHGTNTGSS